MPPFEPPPPAAPAAADPKTVTLSFSPIHLLLPIVEVAIEARPVNHVGITAIGGIGSVTPKSSSESFSAQELGLQLSAYPLEAFDSLTVGVEALYLHVEGNTAGGAPGVGSGFAVGPFVGYKWIAKGGFTLIAQGGVEYVAIEAESSGSTASDSRVLPLINFNVGWSF